MKKRFCGTKKKEIGVSSKAEIKATSARAETEIRGSKFGAHARGRQTEDVFLRQLERRRVCVGMGAICHKRGIDFTSEQA